eukprot:PhF_6_TR10368/c0_g1_i1/m.16111
MFLVTLDPAQHLCWGTWVVFMVVSSSPEMSFQSFLTRQVHNVNSLHSFSQVSRMLGKSVFCMVRMEPLISSQKNPLANSSIQLLLCTPTVIVWEYAFRVPSFQSGPVLMVARQGFILPTFMTACTPSAASTSRVTFLSSLQRMDQVSEVSSVRLLYLPLRCGRLVRSKLETQCDLSVYDWKTLSKPNETKQPSSNISQSQVQFPLPCRWKFPRTLG